MFRLFKKLRVRGVDARQKEENKQPEKWDIGTVEKQREIEIGCALEADRLAHATMIAKDTASEIERNWWNYETPGQKASRVAYWHGRASAIYQLWKLKQEKSDLAREGSSSRKKETRPIDAVYSDSLLAHPLNIARATRR